MHRNEYDSEDFDDMEQRAYLDGWAAGNRSSDRVPIYTFFSGILTGALLSLVVSAFLR